MQRKVTFAFSFLFSLLKSNFTRDWHSGENYVLICLHDIHAHICRFILFFQIAMVALLLCVTTYLYLYDNTKKELQYPRGKKLLVVDDILSYQFIRSPYLPTNMQHSLSFVDGYSFTHFS